MFLGEFRHSLDAKGRLVLPADMRAQLEEGAVITRSNVGRYLVGFAHADFEALARRLAEQTAKDPQLRLVEGQTFAKARAVPLDRAGRILIPENLREWAGLESDVVVAGANDHFRLWDADEYEGAAARADALIPELIGQVRDLTF